jgi:hypothetical protein
MNGHSQNGMLQLFMLLATDSGMRLPACLQVWYSSAWSNSTLEAFRRAVTDLLTTANSLSKLAPQRRSDAHPSADALTAPDVLELLRHWQVKNVTLAAARSAWLDNADNAFGHIANFKRKADRLALSELALTGELRALGAGDTGSVVMFAVPANFGERAFDESFLQVRHPLKQFCSNLHFIDCFARHSIRAIAHNVCWLLSNTPSRCCGEPPVH